MKNVSSHKLKKIIIKAILSLFAVYIIYSLSVSIELYIIINEAFSDKKYDGIVTSYISEEEYNILNPKDSELEENKDIRRDCFVTFPLVLPFFTDAYFTYNYIVHDNNGIDPDTGNDVIYGSYEADAKLKLSLKAFPSYIEEVIYSP